MLINLEEMESFLEKFYLPILKEEEIEIMKSQLQTLKSNCDNKFPPPSPEKQSGARWFHRWILSNI